MQRLVLGVLIGLGLVVYDAQTNRLIGGDEMPLAAGSGAGSGTTWIDGGHEKFATFVDFEGWVAKFMADE